MTLQSTERSAPKWTIARRVAPKDRASSLPGPGSYGSGGLEKTGRFRMPRQVSFGRSSTCEFVKKVPGPGDYTPYDPNWNTLKFTMAGAVRPKSLDAESKLPGPGAHDLDKANKFRDYGKISMRFGKSGDRSLGQISSAPDPGAYTPNYKAIKAPQLAFGFGKASRFELLAASQSPGPGTYNASTERLGGTPGPKFTIKQKGRSGKYDDSPGPQFAGTTQFF